MLGVLEIVAEWFTTGSGQSLVGKKLVKLFEPNPIQVSLILLNWVLVSPDQIH